MDAFMPDLSVIKGMDFTTDTKVFLFFLFTFVPILIYAIVYNVITRANEDDL
jgi:nitrate reductase NapE component